jgi:hypothetical protein
MMEILTVTTQRPTLRSEIVGWTFEDISLHQAGPIGMTPNGLGNNNYPGTVFEALAQGWRLLGPPTRMGHDDAWDWWLIKED